jgi:hypothetical protein
LNAEGHKERADQILSLRDPAIGGLLLPNDDFYGVTSPKDSLKYRVKFK